MPETPNDTTPATAVANPFASMAELWRAHIDLRYALSNADKGAAEARRTASDIRAFIASARATGAALADESERKTAQGILDYWSTELLSLPGATTEDFTPALLAPLDETHAARRQDKSGEVEKQNVDESRELIRTAAAARLWHDSGKPYGYLLLDKATIAQAAFSRHGSGH